MRKLKLTLKKEIISDLEAKDITGGRPVDSALAPCTTTITVKTLETDCHIYTLDSGCNPKTLTPDCAIKTIGNQASCMGTSCNAVCVPA